VHRAKLKLPVTHAEAIAAYVREAATDRVRASKPVDARVDADDAAILGEAMAGAADAFVTGDAAVRRLGKLGGMKILSPREFWALLHSGTGTR
jgi:predicted nucleic acid-binding protein